jgi:hypothetical protein
MLKEKKIEILDGFYYRIQNMVLLTLTGFFLGTRIEISVAIRGMSIYMKYQNK